MSRKKFIIASLLNLAGATFNKFFILFVSFYSAYVLPTTAHGRLSVFIFLVSVLSGVLVQAITISANRIFSVNGGEFSEVTLSACLNVLCFAVLLWLIIVSFVLYDIDLAVSFLSSNTVGRREIYMLLIMMPLNFITALLGGALQGRQMFALLAFSNFIAIILAVPISIYLITTNGVQGAIESLLAHAIIFMLLSLFCFARQKKYLRFVSPLVEGGATVRYVLIPLFVTGALVTPAYWYATKLLTETDNGLAQASLFALVWQFGMILTHVVLSLGGVIMPKMSEADIAYESNHLNYIPPMLVAFLFIVPVVLTVEFWGALVFRGFNGEEVFICMAYILSAIYISSFKSGIARVMALKGVGWLSVISNFIWLCLFLSFMAINKELTASSLSMVIFISHLLSLVLFLPVFLRLNVISYSIIFSRDILFLNIGLALSLLVAIFSNNAYSNVLVASLLSVMALFKLKNSR